MDIEPFVNEIFFRAVRSRGPGGQNVNKVSSAAILCWDFGTSAAVTAEQKSLIRARLAGLINREGLLQVRSDEFRDLARNKERCIEKFLEHLKRAFHKPKIRIPTQPTKASRRRQREAKKHRSDIKKQRSKIS